MAPTLALTGDLGTIITAISALIVAVTSLFTAIANNRQTNKRVDEAHRAIQSNDARITEVNGKVDVSAKVTDVGKKIDVVNGKLDKNTAVTLDTSAKVQEVQDALNQPKEVP